MISSMVMGSAAEAQDEPATDHPHQRTARRLTNARARNVLPYITALFYRRSSQKSLPPPPRTRYNPRIFPGESSMIDHARLERYVTDSRHRFEDLLGQMVEIPSISMDPVKTLDIRRMAEFSRQLLTDVGADVRIVETGGYPIVSGGWTTGVHHPTVTIYNHMDVQPAQEPEWTQAPFAFKNENGLYHGRGATDDKGPALSALFGARYAIEQGVPVNVRFLWELEEEIGSPNFAAGLKSQSAIP